MSGLDQRMTNSIATMKVVDREASYFSGSIELLLKGQKADDGPAQFGHQTVLVSNSVSAVAAAVLLAEVPGERKHDFVTSLSVIELKGSNVHDASMATRTGETVSL